MSSKKLSKLRTKIAKWTKYRSADKRRAEQVAAICTRKKDGKRQVLLVTSRETRRWVIPKGWPMIGLSDGEAAMQEAWEEAGVAEAELVKKPVGKFGYRKIIDKKPGVPVRVTVYRVKVRETAKKFPERHQRKRKWVSPKRAASMVREPGLKKMLISLHK